jgi:hypothetical protein
MTSDVPEFAIRVSAEGRVTLVHAPQAHAYLKRLRAKDGDELMAQFYPYRAKRSDRQNRGFHACITPWAKERGWAIDTLKQFLLGRVFGWGEFVDPMTGEVLPVLTEPHTSKLSVGQFSELIERSLELAAEDGVWLQAPDEYTRAKASAEKRAARTAAREATR